MTEQSCLVIQHEVHTSLVTNVTDKHAMCVIHVLCVVSKVELRYRSTNQTAS
jgi:hypothetical protein